MFCSRDDKTSLPRYHPASRLRAHSEGLQQAPARITEANPCRPTGELLFGTARSGASRHAAAPRLAPTAGSLRAPSTWHNAFHAFRSLRRYCSTGEEDLSSGFLGEGRRNRFYGNIYKTAEFVQEIEQAARKKDVSHIQPRRREERSRRIQREKHDDGPAANEQVGVSIQNINLKY